MKTDNLNSQWFMQRILCKGEGIYEEIAILYLVRLTTFKQCWLKMDFIHLPYSITIKSVGQLI